MIENTFETTEDDPSIVNNGGITRVQGFSHPVATEASLAPLPGLTKLVIQSISFDISTASTYRTFSASDTTLDSSRFCLFHRIHHHHSSDPVADICLQRPIYAGPYGSSPRYAPVLRSPPGLTQALAWEWWTRRVLGSVYDQSAHLISRHCPQPW